MPCPSITISMRLEDLLCKTANSPTVVDHQRRAQKECSVYSNMNGFLKVFCCESIIIFSHVFYKRRVQLVSTCSLTETSPTMDRRSLATEGMAEIHWKQTSRRNTKTSETNNLYGIPSQRPQMVVSKNGRYPQIIHFGGIVHYKPSIMGYPYCRKPTTIHK